ncbi:hypothetical protein [Methylobacterium durans]|uniref:Uncharacterized protein n=1 Tax=Methylobacterium durans TaxID=2202825 RepID=A0A2U8WDL2_9HYPH|nr:hypothetical protein [Methylobacterium durans]AWN43621.1 hypothetical protein DK389_27840 [Methylobacterium durans]
MEDDRNEDDSLLDEALRYLIARGFRVEIVNNGGRRSYFFEGEETDRLHILATARLLGMERSDRAP